MNITKFLLAFVMLGSMGACNQTTDRTSDNTNAQKSASAAEDKSESTSAGSAELKGTWIYDSLQPLGPDGKPGTDTTGLGMFHKSMVGTTLEFTDSTLTMVNKAMTNKGTYQLSEDRTKLFLKRNDKEQTWELRELSAGYLKYTTGGLPIVAVYKKRS